MSSSVRTNQYNPTHMPASAPARVAIAVAALVAVVAGYRWWSSPERQINRLLSDIATALRRIEREGGYDRPRLSLADSPLSGSNP